MRAYYNIHTIWIALILLTLSTYAMGKLGFSGLPIMIVLLLTAAIKGVLIINDFMELKGVITLAGHDVRLALDCDTRNCNYLRNHLLNNN